MGEAGSGSGLNDTWPLWEVFTQGLQGAPYEHAGSLHAVDAEQALQNARDVYARRGEAVSLWVVPSSAIVASASFDAALYSCHVFFSFEPVGGEFRFAPRSETAWVPINLLCRRCPKRRSRGFRRFGRNRATGIGQAVFDLLLVEIRRQFVDALDLRLIHLMHLRQIGQQPGGTIPPEVALPLPGTHEFARARHAEALGRGLVRLYFWHGPFFS